MFSRGQCIESGSGLAHGQDFTGMEPNERRRYRLLENGLRSILPRAIENPVFASLFDSDDSVVSALPLRT